MTKPDLSCLFRNETAFALRRELPSVGPDGGRVPRELEASIRQACGDGRPLDRDLSTRLSGVLDCDLSGIRVHTGREADELNRRLGAEAFTVGENIFFSHGAYGPDSWSGRCLIAHEVIHVLQQRAGGVSSEGSGLTVLSCQDGREGEADLLAAITIATAFEDVPGGPFSGHGSKSSGLRSLLAERIASSRARPARHASYPGVVQRQAAVIIQAARNLIHPLTAESRLRPLNCHEAVLGWLLTSLNYPRRWRLVRLAAARDGTVQTRQFGGIWMRQNIYKGCKKVSQVTVQSAHPGDILYFGTNQRATHSMVVVSKVPQPALKRDAVNIRGFNNSGTFLHLVPPPPRMAYDNSDRNVADPVMWNVTHRHTNTFGIGTGDLFLVRYANARANAAEAFPWEGSPIPVSTGQRWHYNPLLSWRWY